MQPSKPPPIIHRPPLAQWLWQRGLSWVAVAPVFGVGPEQVRRYCLPFGDANRQTPSSEVMARIFEYTAGEIPPGSFYPQLAETEAA